MSDGEKISMWLGALFGFCVGILGMIMLVSDGVIMDMIAGINWFACWICGAIGIVIGMFLASLFKGNSE